MDACDSDREIVMAKKKPAPKSDIKVEVDGNTTKLSRWPTEDEKPAVNAEIEKQRSK